MGRRELALRRPDICVRCGVALAVGTRAQWDADERVVRCLACAAWLASSSSPDLDALDGPVESIEPIELGTPGGSARREFQRRRARREAAVEERWGTGRLGRVAKVLSLDPPSTTAWASGASGEERVAEVLRDELGDRAIVLHDRRVPRTRGNIDHLAIAPSGVWIIDAKRYQGRVEKRDVGGWFSTDLRLYVGGRDRTKLVGGLRWQIDAVVGALAGEMLPTHAALTFVGAEWPLFFAKPLVLSDVWITWPKKLAELIGGPGPLTSPEVERVARRLAASLPAK